MNDMRRPKPEGHDLTANFKKTWSMFLRMAPNILAVSLLSGFIMEFVPLKRFSELLGGGFLTDGLIGAAIGSISIGNPLVSYVLGGELLDQGVSLMAVTALLVSWVTVGSIQLPAEIQTFGGRFALVRNGLSFLFALVIAFLVLASLKLLSAAI
ncbi:MAG: permease [Desulfuromonadales bacterium]|nr:permease [Desulfuromonadales bacterium]MBN2793562.1 permease [Desulfuromonadales bacterium]